MRWLRSIFRSSRAASSEVETRPSSDASPDDWAAGDLAENLFGGLWLDPNAGTFVSGPRHGEVRAVAAVKIFAEPMWGETQFLEFARFPGRPFAARSFRKIVPRADALERAEPVFIEQLRPVPVTEPVT